VKSIEATLIALAVGFALVTEAQAEDYYFYEGPKGELVISNKEPPPGSKIIKQQNLSEATDSQFPQDQQRNNPNPNVQTEGSPKPSNNK
jgi:hypothetical protein